MKHFLLWDLKLFAGDPRQAQAYIERCVRTRRILTIYTPNLHHLRLLSVNPVYQRAYKSADLLLPDGMSITLFARLVLRVAAQRINGTNIVFSLLSLSARRGYTVFFLGSTPHVQARLARVLVQEYPTLRYGQFSPPVADHVSKEAAEEMVARVNAFAPDILFVALGAPKQEEFLFDQRTKIHATVRIAVGGAFEYVARAKPRAPRILQEAGLEWAFRLACEPARLGSRYIQDVLFVLRSLRDIMIYRWVRF